MTLKVRQQLEYDSTETTGDGFLFSKTIWLFKALNIIQLYTIITSIDYTEQSLLHDFSYPILKKLPFQGMLDICYSQMRNKLF